METIVEAVEDSEEANLHCSIRGYHIAVWSTAMENWKCSSEWQSSYDVGGHWIDTPMIKSMIATL